MEDRAGEIIDKGGRENAHVMMGARGTGMCPLSSTMFGCNYIVCRLGPEFHDQADRVALETLPSRGVSRVVRISIPPSFVYSCLNRDPDAS